MRVVVTRPEISADKTAERLKVMGHEPILLPLSKAIHKPQDAMDALASPHSALVMTSAEAVRTLAGIDPPLDADFGLPLFAVGEKTAAAARSVGFRNVHVGSGDGDSLADLIASQLEKSGLPLLYLAGKPRAGSLERRLEQSDTPVRVTEIYEMIAIDYSPEDIGARLSAYPAQAVLLYSRENAIRFFDLAERHALQLSETKFLCISQRTADAVPAAFRAHLRMAETPDEIALLALL